MTEAPPPGGRGGARPSPHTPRAAASGARPLAALALGLAILLAFGLGLALLVPALRAPLVAALARADGAAPPAFGAVRASFRPSDVRILDRDGALLGEKRIDPWRRRLAWTPLAEISPRLVEAVIASEDRRFRDHAGIDWRALAAAAASALRDGRRGGSTIEMQLAALLDQTLTAAGRRRGLRLKLAQLERAAALDRAWTKDEILEAYLNLAPWRGELSGISAAARELFGKAPDGLSGAEAATLAALLRAPNATREALEPRALGVARRLPDAPAEAEVSAASARATATRRVRAPRPDLAPHLAAQLLARGAPDGAIRTTLDAGLQRAAIDSLQRNLVGLLGRGARDGAVLVVDNASGEVLAYVGSSGRLSRAPQVDGVRARRQAGSTLKPFLYATAIDRRLLTAASLIDDTPLEIASQTGLYRPRNYDERFRGPVSLRTALASSLNIPAVRTIELAGEGVLLERLRRLGMAGLTAPAEHYGAALALGGADVTLWELVAAYRALANDGVAGAARLTPAGDAGEAVRVFSPEAAFIVADVLSDRESRSATFGLESPLGTRFWTAVKTGTSKDMRDNWCIGFSRRYSVGVWIGNSSGAPMHDVSGVSGAAPVWVELMTRLHAALQSEPPPAPPGVTRAAVSFPRDAEPPREEWFVAGTEPSPGPRARAAERPRIASPQPRTVFALDPDIPADRQRVAFAARGAAEARFVLDGAPLAAARAIHLWRPRAGRHELLLIDAEGRTLDRVGFEVRGGEPAATRGAPRARRIESGAAAPFPRLANPRPPAGFPERSAACSGAC